MVFFRKESLLVLGIMFVSLNIDAQMLNKEGLIGKSLPESFSLRLLQAPDTVLVNSNVLNGHVVVLEFWGTWCAPCIKTIPHMNELVHAFRDAPVTFISITDESKAIVQRFLKRKKMSSWIGLDLDRELTEWAEISSYPTVLVLDTNGIVQEVMNPDQLDISTIETYLDNTTNNEEND
ncbi:MAG: TlpA disulfide reductase family protein [Bacteroidota bacterium]